MPNGFQTVKDILEVIVIPIALALIAYAYPEIQNASRRRKFIKLIIRELQELSPYPEIPQRGKKWWEHHTKNFVHKKIFESPSENRDFILSLPPDMVYWVSNLWGALETHDEKQWLHYLNMLSQMGYDENDRIKKAHNKWLELINSSRKS